MLSISYHVISFLILISLFACGESPGDSTSTNDSAASDTSSSSSEMSPIVPQGHDAQERTAQEIYQKRCQECHADITQASSGANHREGFDSLLGFMDRGMAAHFGDASKAEEVPQVEVPEEEKRFLLNWFALNLDFLSSSDTEADDTSSSDESEPSAQDTGNLETRTGREMYEESGPFGFGCVSCHGPEGDKSGKLSSRLNPFSADLQEVSLQGDALKEEVSTMWDKLTGRGSGSFSKLSAAEQDNLVFYVQSFQKVSLCINNSLFGSDKLRCQYGAGCGLDPLNELIFTYEDVDACVDACTDYLLEDNTVDKSCQSI